MQKKMLRKIQKTDMSASGLAPVIKSNAASATTASATIRPADTRLATSAFIFAIFLVCFLASGCMQQPTRLGCCLKQNATAHEGCVLYNDTADAIIDLTTQTHTESDGQKCNVTAGHCNVTYSPTQPPYDIPVCTEADITTCRQPDCLTMVCGDFKFKPPISPVLSVGGESGEEVTTDVPATKDEESAIQFYRAQCRFLPMDGSLKKIMKNTKSSINVFRVGVGASFDEYEQYRYLFPMSDKFCAVNPAKNNELRVDRYMNYLNPSTKAQYDPAVITTNCIDESDGSVPQPPYRYNEASVADKSGSFIQDGETIPYYYSAVLKDRYNYKFAHWGRLDYRISTFGITGYTSVSDPHAPGGHILTPDYGFTGYNFNSPFFDNSTSVYKKIDESYYKKWLSIVHSDTIYGLSATRPETTRAPFECDASAMECYSGTCNTNTYNRIVMLSPPDATGFSREIITDCESYTDEFRHTKIICSPTKTIASAGTTSPPEKTYARVDARVIHLEGYGREENITGSGCGTYNSDLLNVFYGWQYTGSYGYSSPWGDYRCPNVMGSKYMQDAGIPLAADVGMIKNTAVPDAFLFEYNSSSEHWMLNFTEASVGPSAGGALFFGNVEPEARYRGKKVIGYALASRSEVRDLLVVKNCNMIEGINYDIVDVPAYPSQWGELKSTFGGYFKQRYSGMSAASTDDDCGATTCKLYDDAAEMVCANFYDFFFPSLPWVINFDKQAHPEYNYSTHKPTEQLLVSSEITMGMKKINRFSENYITTGDANTCALRRLASGWISPASRGSDGTDWYVWVGTDKPTYDLLYSKQIVLFYDNGTQQIGSNCALDKATGLPKIRTYGWCEPCTTSTLAYQKVTTQNDPYVPGGIANIENGGSIDLNSWDRRICIGSYDDLNCANNLISAMNDYSQHEPEMVVAPATIPEASILKERMGNYMKSGVMPVLDLSNDSNWAVRTLGDTSEYDFQRLIGKMGAAIVIVDHVNDTDSAQAKAAEIGDRTALVRSRCYGCLAAFHVDSPVSNESLYNITSTVFNTNFASRFSTDIITYDYPVSQHSFGFPLLGLLMRINDSDVNLTAEFSEMITDDIASHSQAILRAYQKPTLLVGLNVDTSDVTWRDLGTYESLFTEILTSQDKLVKSGLIGIIYAPARSGPFPTYFGSQNGLVDLSGDVGVKNQKFCALQKAMQRMTATPPIAIYTKGNTVNQSYCVPCSSLEITQGLCGADALLCDNGISCTPQPGYSLAESTGTYKCTPETVIDDPTGQRCTLCQDTPGTYTCTIAYANGSVFVAAGSVAELNSDIYMDYIGGIGKPDKCCLESPDGYRYTYVKRSNENQLNKPITFSKTGDPQVDCGMSVDMDAVKETQSFCSIPIPLKDYDVTCTISG